MISNEVQIAKGFLLGIGLIILSVIILIFIKRFAHYLYEKSSYKNYILFGDKPEYMISRARMGSIILLGFGLYILIITLIDFFK